METPALLATGQAAFLAMMASCLAIRPSPLAVQRGLSFYGNQAETIVPYVAGFAACVALTALGVARLRGGDAFLRRFRLGTTTIVGLMALVPLTPYSVDLVVDYLHIGITTVLFSSALLFGAWLGCVVLRRPLALAAVATETAAGVLVLTAQVGLHDLMIPSQLVFDVAFAVLVVMAAAHLAAQAR
jgi:hypothetical protein